MGLIERTRSALGRDSERASLEHMYGDWQNAQAYGQSMYGYDTQPLLNGNVAEKIGPDFIGLASGAYRGNGVVFACMALRQAVFSTVRFQYQRLAKGRPSAMFGDQSLLLLEEPWPGGTTQDLLNRVINDADLAGNSFNIVETSLATLGGDGGQQIVRLRPDWVTVVTGLRASGLGREKLGYGYCEGGYGSGHEIVPLLARDVAHFAPKVDPLASYRGMSWLTPIIREVIADGLMTTHKRSFFENGATPNMVIKHPAGMDVEKVRAFRDRLNAEHQGAINAYKSLHIGGGADVTVVGANFQQLEFALSQGHGETRIAAAAETPPLLVGLSGGMDAAQYANYMPTRRRFADGTMYPLWQNVSGCFAPLMPRQDAGVRLWFDTRDVPFLREDEKDAAEIQQIQAATMASWIQSGYTAESVQAAMLADDIGLLVHSGLFSVQLQEAGSLKLPTKPGATDLGTGAASIPPPALNGKAKTPTGAPA